jgi:DNA-binding transcriptional MerR regulator
MAETAAPIEIPRRALFKAAEVCEILHVQPYVLRSWEAEFPELGVARTAGGPRVYRRRDVERAARVRHLLLVEGLTLAGARRKLEEDTTPPVLAGAEGLDDLLGQHARERLTEIKRGLREILNLLDRSNGEAASPGVSAPAKRARPGAVKHDRKARLVTARRGRRSA